MTAAAARGKRARTSERLMICGLELFERQGFDQTTVAQIATAAGVTEMTFFRHFPAKEMLVVDDPYDPVIAAEVAAQPLRLAPLARVVRGVRAAWARLPEPESDVVRRRVRIAASTPSLRAAIARNNGNTERLIAEQLIADGVGSLPARAAAAAVLAALTAALFEWSLHNDLQLADAVLTALDTVDPRHG